MNGSSRISLSLINVGFRSKYTLGFNRQHKQAQRPPVTRQRLRIFPVQREATFAYSLFASYSYFYLSDLSDQIPDLCLQRSSPHSHDNSHVRTPFWHASQHSVRQVAHASWHALHAFRQSSASSLHIVLQFVIPETGLKTPQNSIQAAFRSMHKASQLVYAIKSTRVLGLRPVAHCPSHVCLAILHVSLQGSRVASHCSSHSLSPDLHASRTASLHFTRCGHLSAVIVAMAGITGWGALSSAGRWSCPVTGESVAESPSAVTKDPMARVESNRTLNRFFMVLEKGGTI